MEQIVSWYKDIVFSNSLKGLELSYSGPPRLDASEAVKREKAAHQSGREEATNELNEQILQNRREVQQLLGETLEILDRKIDDCLKDMMDEIPELVVQICRRVLADVEIDGHKIKAIVDDVIADLPTHKETIEIFLSPHDLELFMKYMEDPEKNYPKCKFSSDSTLGSADCRVVSRFGAIDARVSTKLKHIQEQLSG
jgi:flagellar biosynthesis/type III secretory pathway protein FliH